MPRTQHKKPIRSGYRKLCCAAAANDMDKVQRYIQQDVPAQLDGSSLTPPIVSAVENNNLLMLKYLVSEGADVNTHTVSDSLLTRALKQKNVSIAEYLLSLKDSHGFPLVRVNWIDQSGKRAFDYADFHPDLIKQIVLAGHAYLYSDAELDAAAFGAFIVRPEAPQLEAEGAEAAFMQTEPASLSATQEVRLADFSPESGEPEWTALGAESAMMDASIVSTKQSSARLEKRVKFFEEKTSTEKSPAFLSFIEALGVKKQVEDGSLRTTVRGTEYYWPYFYEAWQFFQNDQTVIGLLASLSPLFLLQEYGARYIARDGKRSVVSIEAVAAEQGRDYLAYLIECIFGKAYATKEAMAKIKQGSQSLVLPQDFIRLILKDFKAQFDRFKTFNFYVHKDIFPCNRHFKCLALVWAGAHDEDALFDGVSTQFVLAQLVLEIAGAAFRGNGGTQSCNLGFLQRMLSSLSFRHVDVRMMTETIRELDSQKMTKEWVAVYFTSLLKEVLKNLGQKEEMIQIANHWQADRLNDPAEYHPATTAYLAKLTQCMMDEAMRCFTQSFPEIDVTAFKELHSMAMGYEATDYFQDIITSMLNDMWPRLSNKSDQQCDDEAEYFVLKCLRAYLKKECDILVKCMNPGNQAQLQPRVDKVVNLLNRLPALSMLPQQSEALGYLDLFSDFWLHRLYGRLLQQSSDSVIRLSFQFLKAALNMPTDPIYEAIFGINEKTDLEVMQNLPSCLQNVLGAYRTTLESEALRQAQVRVHEQALKRRYSQIIEEEKKGEDATLTMVRGRSLNDYR